VLAIDCEFGENERRASDRVQSPGRARANVGIDVRSRLSKRRGMRRAKPRCMICHPAPALDRGLRAGEADPFAGEDPRTALGNPGHLGEQGVIALLRRRGVDQQGVARPGRHEAAVGDHPCTLGLDHCVDPRSHALGA